jgi:hypothetical protein
VRREGNNPANRLLIVGLGDDSMRKPLVATVSHTLGREAAKQRIAGSFDRIRAQLAPFASVIAESWTDDRLDFRLTALGQAISGHLDVFDDYVRVEIMLPGMLGFLGNSISSRVQDFGVKLLDRT